MGTAGSLYYLKDKLKKNFILMNADIITNLDFSSLINFHKKIEILFLSLQIRLAINFLRVLLSILEIELKPLKKNHRLTIPTMLEFTLLIRNA